MGRRKCLDGGQRSFRAEQIGRNVFPLDSATGCVNVTARPVVEGAYLANSDYRPANQHLEQAIDRMDESYRTRLEARLRADGFRNKARLEAKLLFEEHDRRIASDSKEA